MDIWEFAEIYEDLARQHGGAPTTIVARAETVHTFQRMVKQHRARRKRRRWLRARKRAARSTLTVDKQRSFAKHVDQWESERGRWVGERSWKPVRGKTEDGATYTVVDRDGNAIEPQEYKVELIWWTPGVYQEDRINPVLDGYRDEGYDFSGIQVTPLDGGSALITLRFEKR